MELCPKPRAEGWGEKSQAGRATLGAAIWGRRDVNLSAVSDPPLMWPEAALGAGGFLGVVVRVQEHPGQSASPEPPGPAWEPGWGWGGWGGTGPAAAPSRPTEEPQTPRPPASRLQPSRAPRRKGYPPPPSPPPPWGLGPAHQPGCQSYEPTVCLPPQGIKSHTLSSPPGSEAPREHPPRGGGGTRPIPHRPASPESPTPHVPLLNTLLTNNGHHFKFERTSQSCPKLL